MTTLTKQDTAAIRAADDITVHLNERHPNGLVQLVKRRDYNKPFSEDQYHQLSAEVYLRRDGMRAREVANGIECFAMRGIYHSQRTAISIILKSLRVGDELRFEFRPDAHSNGYIARANLHGDALYLDVYRGGKHIANWCIETSVCPSNSARMVRGVPDSDSYASMAADARRNAA